MVKEDDKNKAKKKKQKVASKTGSNFKNPAALRAKEKENIQRKFEIIETYLRVGSYYRAAKALDMKRNTLRQLIIKWEESGDVDIVRRRMKGLGNIAAILGEMVSLDKSDERVKATVTFEQKDLGYLRLGVVEMRFISQEIIGGEPQRPGPV